MTVRPMHWRDEYEAHADGERRALDSLPIARLLEDVQRGRYGDYYGIWHSIAARASLKDAGWILLEVLNRNIDYLYRYHCAAALLTLAQVRDLEPVQLSGGAGHGTTANLRRMRALLEERLGPRTTG